MQKNSQPNQLLLLEDVVNLGRKGDLVKAKPGFARNFLLPKKKAVIADKRTIRLQERLKEERVKQAAVDKKESEAFAAQIKGKTLKTNVKSDKEGHLYGSVAVVDIVKILEEEEGVKLERRNVVLPKPIKTVGTFEIQLRLKEDVPATFFLKVIGEGQIEEVKSRVKVKEEGTEDLSEQGVSEEGEPLPTLKEQKAEMCNELEERSKK
jgi:large subunit ribosomal protein L9